MNKCNLSISLRSIKNNNNTLCKGGVGILEIEDNNQEEDLVTEEAKSYVIIVGSQEIFPKIVKVL